MLRDGVPVEYRRDDGSIAGDHVRLIDFDNPDANDWLAVNQLTVIEGQNNRRPDIVVFVNGLPLGIIELKVPEDTDKWFGLAYNQIQTYKQEIPSLMHYNELTVVSDGLEARIGSLTANQEWFKVRRTIEGEFDAPATALELATLVRSVFEKRRFLDLIRNFIAFEDDADRGTTNKIIAGYHQFFAVKAAVDETLRATAKDRVAEAAGTYWAGKMEGGKPGDRRVGVIWHT
jgi:type I restriction enzyme, R subunit